MPENANEHCPGTASEQAGKASSCAGCPNQTICASTPKGPDPDAALITAKMSCVRHIILVLSGKGGVGKSTFAAHLARALAANEGMQVGLLDIDLCGPSIPKIMGCEAATVHRSQAGWSPVYVADNLGVMSVAFLLGSADEAVVWRGPKKNGMIKSFMLDVDWGDALDYLVIDTPPGTSDEHISVVQMLKHSNLAGAVVITGPQEVSLLDVRKEISFCKKVSLPVLGVVENMSGFVCKKCGTETLIFPPSTGGGAAMAAEMAVPFLGRIPLDPALARACDSGLSYLDLDATSPGVTAFRDVIARISSAVQ